MNHSENINEIIAALLKVQNQPMVAIKQSANPFHKSKYADLNEVLGVSMPILNAHGLVVMQLGSIEAGQPVLVTMVTHTSGQWIKSILPLNPAKNDPQGIGAAITYMRRYGLSALVGLTCDNDDDGETASGRGKIMEKKQVKAEMKSNESKIDNSLHVEKRIDDQQIKALNIDLFNLDLSFRDKFFKHILKAWNANAINDIPLDKFETSKRVLAILKTDQKQKEKEVVNA